MKRVRAPAGFQNVSYGGRVVGPEGIEVDDHEALALEAQGWTVVEPAPPAEPAPTPEEVR